MSHASCRRLLWLVLLPSVLSLAGCTKTKLYRAARFEPGEEMSITRAAPADGTYKVKWLNPRDGELHTVHGTERLLFKGQRLGFGRDEDGRVLAVAGEEAFALGRLNRHAGYCVWVGKVKKETKFAGVMRETAEITGRVVATGAVVTGVVALGIANACLDAADDDCDDDESLFDLDDGDDDSDRDHRRGKKDKRRREQKARSGRTVPAGPLP